MIGVDKQKRTVFINADHFIPAPEQEQRVYAPMLQGTGTNQLSRISTRGKQPNLDVITGNATISKGTLKVFIERYNDLGSGLTVSTHKLLDACTIALTAQNNYRGSGELNTAVIIPLDEYMKMCDIPLTKPSKDKTRRTVKADLQSLFSMKLSWEERSGKNTKDFDEVRICSRIAVKNGNILFNFTPEIAHYLVNAYVMQYPIELLKIDERNPNAYYIGKKLLQHFSIDNNFRKGTSNIISVKALLEWCEDTIPSYEEVMRGNRHVDERIIKPLENALDALQSANVIAWEYCNSKKTALTVEQLQALNYQTFIGLYIHFEAVNAPDQTARLEARSEEIKAKVTKKKAIKEI